MQRNVLIVITARPGHVLPARSGGDNASWSYSLPDGQQTVRQVTDAQAGEEDVTFTYNLEGQRLSMTQGQETTLWTYDRLGRLTSVTNPDGSNIGYTYDALGNCLTVTTHIDASDVSGKTITYTYDKLGRKTSVTDWQA